MASKNDEATALSFALFDNKKKEMGDKRPEIIGKIQFTRAFLQTLVEQAKTGSMPEVSIALWRRISKRDQEYYSGMARFEKEWQPKPDSEARSSGGEPFGGSRDSEGSDDMDPFA